MLLSRVVQQTHVLACLLVSLSWAHPLKRTTSSHALIADFPDPSILKVGSTWWAFATSTGNIHAQVATANDFDAWTKTGKDALPKLPSWVNAANPQVWAPDVIQRVSGKKLLHFMIYI